MHQCPIDGCFITDVSDERIMCTRHWDWYVPKQLGQSLLAAWQAVRSGDTKRVDEYRQRLGQVVSIVNGKVREIRARRFDTPKGHEKYGQRHTPARL